MVELTFQGILSTPFEPKGTSSGKSVYHVSERAFTMSPVYTEGWLAPALSAEGATYRGMNGAHF